RSPGGTERPSAFAVLRLMTNSNLVDRSTGKYADRSPLRMRPPWAILVSKPQLRGKHDPKVLCASASYSWADTFCYVFIFRICCRSTSRYERQVGGQDAHHCGRQWWPLAVEQGDVREARAVREGPCN